MDKLIEEMEKNAEEYGYLHNEDCPANMEDPDACECDNLKMAKEIAREAMESVNKYWIEMCKAHSKHCTPEGRKDITRLVGKKNRTPTTKSKEESN